MLRQLYGLTAALALASPAYAGSLTITVPDSKDAVVVAAKDAYNARTGQSLSVAAWVKAVVKDAVVAELDLAQGQTEQDAITAKQAELNALIQSQDASRATARESSKQGW